MRRDFGTALALDFGMSWHSKCPLLKPFESQARFTAAPLRRTEPKARRAEWLHRFQPSNPLSMVGAIRKME